MRVCSRARSRVLERAQKASLLTHRHGLPFPFISSQATTIVNEWHLWRRDKVCSASARVLQSYAGERSLACAMPSGTRMRTCMCAVWLRCVCLCQHSYLMFTVNVKICTVHTVYTPLACIQCVDTLSVHCMQAHTDAVTLTHSLCPVGVPAPQASSCRGTLQLRRAIVRNLPMATEHGLAIIIQTHTRTHAHTHTHTHTHTHHTHAHVCMYVCVYVCMYRVNPGHRKRQIETADWIWPVSSTVL